MTKQKQIKWQCSGDKGEVTIQNIQAIVVNIPPIVTSLLAAVTAPSNLVPPPDGQFFWIGLL